VLSHTARPLWTSTNPWEGHCAPTLDADPPQGSGGFALGVQRDLGGGGGGPVFPGRIISNVYIVYSR
jgi:hypothetical protein